MSLFKLFFHESFYRQQKYLHSNMSLFKLCSIRQTVLLGHIYIPICLYLNFLRRLWYQHLLRYLHSNMSLFKFVLILFLNFLFLIYIPICLYLNPSPGFPLFFYLIPQLSVDQPKFTNILPYLPH